MTDRVQIARAICESTLWPGAWEQANDVERDNWLHNADAVLALKTWRTIDSAPKDGTDILVWKPHHLVVIARWTGHGYIGGPCWFSAYYSAPMPDAPTHWMPMPQPPTETAE